LKKREKFSEHFPGDFEDISDPINSELKMFSVASFFYFQHNASHTMLKKYFIINGWPNKLLVYKCEEGAA